MLINDFKDVDRLSHKDFEIFIRDLLEASGWTDSVITEVGKEYPIFNTSMPQFNF